MNSIKLNVKGQSKTVAILDSTAFRHNSKDFPPPILLHVITGLQLQFLDNSLSSCILLAS